MNQLTKRATFYHFIFLISICIAPFSALHAEGGDDEGSSNIKGKIVTNEGLPAVGVTVSLTGTKRNSITDDDGDFHFKNIAAGEYEV